MRRWTWDIFCAASLLILAASATLCVRSYFVKEEVDWYNDWVEKRTQGGVSGTANYFFISDHGAVRLLRIRAIWNDPGYAGSSWKTREWRHKHGRDFMGDVYQDLPDDTLNLRFAGFQFAYGIFKNSNGWQSHKSFSFPLWIFLIFALPPLLWLRKRRRAGGRGFAVEVAAAAPVE